eukprot:245005-Prymnesium_polylepis.1
MRVCDACGGGRAGVEGGSRKKGRRVRELSLIWSHATRGRRVAREARPLLRGFVEVRTWRAAYSHWDRGEYGMLGRRVRATACAACVCAPLSACGRCGPREGEASARAMLRVPCNMWRGPCPSGAQHDESTHLIDVSSWKGV